MAGGRRGRLCLGAIVGAHGVRGLVRLKSFTEVPEDIAAYGPLGDEAGRRVFSLRVTGRAKGLLLARVEGVADRDAAEALRGTRLYVEREALPEPEDEDTFYHADLIGLAVETRDGRPLGRVRALHDFGAGDVIELEGGPAGAPAMLPFTREVFPEIDLAAGRLIADPPEEVEARPEGGQKEREAGP